MEQKESKRIEVVEVKISELTEMPGNPRKCTKNKREELKKSFELFGDFSIIVIDENKRIISGHQRVKVLRSMYGDDYVVLCKMLIGYSEPELKAINIKANTHAGEFDLDKLAAWTADLTIDLGLDIKVKDAENHEIKEMELMHYEKYDYVLLVCRNELDYLNLVRDLGIDGEMIRIPNTNRKIHARAVWYDKLNVKIVPNGK